MEEAQMSNCIVIVQFDRPRSTEQEPTVLETALAAQRLYAHANRSQLWSENKLPITQLGGPPNFESKI